MAIPLPFFLRSSSDHETPYSGAVATPGVVLWSPGAPGGAWFAPAGAVSQVGGGWWEVAADAADQAGGDPLLLYATTAGVDPAPAVFWPAGSTIVAGSTSPPWPLWLGTYASGDYQPRAGASPAITLAVAGGAPTAAAGSVAEPGGAGNGHGFYLYTPAAAEVATAGDALMTATGPDGATWAWDYAVGSGAGPSAPTITWPAPAPIAAWTPLSAAQLNATSAVPGTFAYAPAAGVPLPPGDYTLSAVFTPSDPASWSPAAASVPLSVVAPVAAARTLVGAVAAAAAAALAGSFPGGVHKDVAAQKRPAGAFLCAADEATVSVVNQTSNRIEVREFDLRVYATRAADASALMDGVVKPWFLAAPPAPAGSAFRGAQVAEDEPVDETDDYAPQGGNRLNRARVRYRCWLSFPTR